MGSRRGREPRRKRSISSAGPSRDGVMPALMRVLSPATRSAIESDLRTLVDGLSRPEGLNVQVSGEVAAVQIQGGHLVRLRREGGVWKVEDFD